MENLLVETFDDLASSLMYHKIDPSRKCVHKLLDQKQSTKRKVFLVKTFYVVIFALLVDHINATIFFESFATGKENLLWPMISTFTVVKRWCLGDYVVQNLSNHN